VTLDLETQYLVNIPYINAFFEQDMLPVVEDDSYLNYSIAALKPPLQIASKQYDLEKTAKFKMVDIINKTREDIDVTPH